MKIFQEPIALRILCICAGLVFSSTPAAFSLDVDRVKPSVVRIFNFLEEDDGLSTGTGFVVHSAGKHSIVVTNAHVVEGRKDQDSIMILRSSSKGIELYEGEVLWEEDFQDLAILKVEGLSAPALPLSNVNPRLGEDVYALGFPAMVDDHASIEEFVKIYQQSDSHILKDPAGKALRVVEPTLSKAAVRRIVDGKWDQNDPRPEFRIIEHDVNIGPGNSGGPLLNACGEVVGINTFIEADNSISGAVRKSSHAVVLIHALRSQKIPCAVISKHCIGAAGGSSHTLIILVVSVCALAIAISMFAVLRRPAILRETYTQFLRRPAGNPSPPPIPSQPIPAKPTIENSETDSKNWLLEGINPESGKAAQIHVQVDPSKAGNDGRLIIGRRREVVHLHIPNTSISGQHANLYLGADGQLRIEDRNSSNGTKVNGVPLQPFVVQSLKAGDRIDLGEVKLHLRTA